VDEFLYGKDDAILDFETDCGARVLDGLVSVLDLKYATVWRVGTR